ncbi:MAG: Crp/Fnr family transcriptional regulator [Rhodothermales bacterium]
MPTHSNQFLVHRAAGISMDEADKLIAISRVQEIEAGAFFIRAGDVPKKMAIVLSGLFRYLYIDSEGNEYTKAFMPEMSFLTSYSSMIRGEASYYFIEAMEASEILVFSYQDWNALKNTSPAWKDLLIKLLEKGYGAKEKRERDLLLLDAETRYRNFCEAYPGLESRVKQKEIASYLGIKPESLSRIKKNIQPT